MRVCLKGASYKNKPLGRKETFNANKTKRVGRKGRRNMGLKEEPCFSEIIAGEPWALEGEAASHGSCGPSQRVDPDPLKSPSLALPDVWHQTPSALDFFS